MRELAAEWTARRCFFMGAFEKTSGEFAAQVYIAAVNWDLPEFEIGYFADVDHEGKGYVTEAVQAVLASLLCQAGARRVRLQTDETNRRSLGVAERCGFTLEGRPRETKRKPDGTTCDDLIFGLLKREFEADNPQKFPST